MLEKTYKRANEIKEEMSRLKFENDMLLDTFCSYIYKKRLYSIKPKMLNRALKKNRYPVVTDYDGKYCFSLSNEDLRVLLENRLKRYHELKKEFEELQENDKI